MKKKGVTFHITEDLWNNFHLHCQKHGLNMSTFLSILIEEIIKLDLSYVEVLKILNFGSWKERMPINQIAEIENLRQEIKHMKPMVKSLVNYFKQQERKK